MTSEERRQIYVGHDEGVVVVLESIPDVGASTVTIDVDQNVVTVSVEYGTVTSTVPAIDPDTPDCDAVAVAVCCGNCSTKSDQNACQISQSGLFGANA